MFRKPSILQSQKLVQRKRVLAGLKVLAIILGIIFLLGFISWLSNIRPLRINHIYVQGNSAVTSSQIEATALSVLQGRYYNFFARANTLLYPKGEIADALQDAFNWIKNISIERKGFTALSISITERTPTAAWCGEAFETSAECFLLDDRGVIFAEAPNFSGSVYTKLYGTLSTTIIIGAQFADPLLFSHILAFVKALPSIGLQPVRGELTKAKEYTLYLKSGTELLVDGDDSPEKMIANLKALLTDPEFVESQTRGFSNLEYLDLRFGNKMYYKFK